MYQYGCTRIHVCYFLCCEGGKFYELIMSLAVPSFHYAIRQSMGVPSCIVTPRKAWGTRRDIIDSEEARFVNILRVIGASMFLIACALVMLSNLVFSTMIGEVNAKREGEKYWAFGIHPAKFASVMNLHREYYPQSSTRRQFEWLLGIGISLAGASFIVLFLSAIDLRLGRKVITAVAR